MGRCSWSSWPATSFRALHYDASSTRQPERLADQQQQKLHAWRRTRSIRRSSRTRHTTTGTELLLGVRIGGSYAPEDFGPCPGFATWCSHAHVASTSQEPEVSHHGSV